MSLKESAKTKRRHSPLRQKKLWHCAQIAKTQRQHEFLLKDSTDGKQPTICTLSEEYNWVEDSFELY